MLVKGVEEKIKKPGAVEFKGEVEIWTDGSSICVGGEWHGSYGGVVVKGGVELMRYRGYEKGGTIGKMELRAIVSGIQMMTEFKRIEVYSDSQYVVNGGMSWIEEWVRRRFKNVKHPEEWENYLRVKKGKEVVLMWERGHNGRRWNEEADKMVRQMLGEGVTNWKVTGETEWFETINKK